MAITKDKKRAISAKLADAFKAASSIVFVRFNKLSVAETSKMRKALKKEGVGYYVAKKTLMKRALAEQGIKGDLPALEGEVAIVWSEGDSTLPARGIYEFARKSKGALAILGGVFEGMFADAGKMTAIATIPALPVLRGMFVNVINSPIQSLAIALNEIAKKKGA